MKIRGHYIADRDNWLIDQCAGKRVLHLGCTDWPLTRDRLERGVLLHQKLVNVCQYVVGVDPDEEGVHVLGKAMSGHVFHVCKAEHMHTFPGIAGLTWDIVLAADVIEHVSDVGEALSSIASIMNPKTQLVITTPSAFSLKRFIAWAFGGVEHVHPDHCYYFSPSTLHRILGRSRLRMESYGFFMWKNRRTINRLFNTLMLPVNHLLKGRLADEIAVIATLGNEKYDLIANQQ